MLIRLTESVMSWAHVTLSHMQATSRLLVSYPTKQRDQIMDLLFKVPIVT